MSYHMKNNVIGLEGIEFVEFVEFNKSHCGADSLDRLFRELGFSKVARHAHRQIECYQQNQITFLVNSEAGSFGNSFFEKHGPSISAMGWRFQDPKRAYEIAVSRGARPCLEGDYRDSRGNPVPAIFGIGDSLIYFVGAGETLGFEKLQDPTLVPDKGFILIDHLTNNVFKGTMQEWANFYKSVFEFEEVRYFDIRGQKTGLTSYALRAPEGQFCIPINEADEAKSQINEYLEEYKGPGIQHLAFLTKDLIRSIQLLQDTSIKTLDIASDYYRSVFERVPQVKEDRSQIERLNILVDGDDGGYLLQIFTKNLVGPIFLELIQRENHLSFGEGNFQALFDSIERDQMKRGVL